jgi:hypothetical protein
MGKLNGDAEKTKKQSASSTVAQWADEEGETTATG